MPAPLARLNFEETLTGLMGFILIMILWDMQLKMPKLFRQCYEFDKVIYRNIIKVEDWNLRKVESHKNLVLFGKSAG